jgi:ketopantoate reductase
MEALRCETALLSDGDVVPESDWVLLCVRGEQLDQALRELVARFGAQRRVVVAAVTFGDVIERARSHGLQGRVLAFHASFGSWRDPEQAALFHWFPFHNASVVTSDGDRDGAADAAALATALAESGVPTRSMISMRSVITLLAALSTALTAGWDLCDFRLERLAKDRAIRALTARAMAEAARSLRWRGARRPLMWVPPLAYSLLLRILPFVVGRDGREVWLHHGPKIREQTQYFFDQVVGHADESATPLPALRELFERWRMRLEQDALAAQLTA